jgi:putative nucleotidyltransferase with HDIG domain
MDFDSARLGMACGGGGLVLIEYVDSTKQATLELHRGLLELLTSGRKGWLVAVIQEAGNSEATVGKCLVDSDGSVSGDPVRPPEALQVLARNGGTYDLNAAGDPSRVYVQPVGVQGTAYVFGAGHCGERLVPVLNTVGFFTVVIDDRADFADRARFPSADRIVVPESFDGVMATLSIDEDSYIVILTRGHVHDKNVLRQALRTQAGYVGMMGSDRKVAEIFQALREEGFSPKSLLPLGSVAAIERLIGSVSRAEVDDIIVVTGHDPDKISPVLERLPARRAHNAGYESGMFSSVLTGAAALGDDVEAFLILPADYALLRSEVLDRLIHSFREDGRGIVHPSCCGLRGHPPLISGRYRKSLLGTDSGESLLDFFQKHHEDEVEVETEDLTILMDMDTAEDYRRMSRFAGFLDAAVDAAEPAEAAVDAAEPVGRDSNGTTAGVTKGSPPVRSTAVSPEDALYLLSLLRVPDQVVRHCQTVAAVAEALVEALKPYVPCLDVDLVRAAGLLHDLAKAKPKHAVVAQHILSNLGLTRLGEVVGAHMVLPPEQSSTPSVTEEQVVYLADKLVIEDRVAGFEERAARAVSKRGLDPATMEGVRTRMRTAQIIQEKIETILQRSLGDVLPRDGRS